MEVQVEEMRQAEITVTTVIVRSPGDRRVYPESSYAFDSLMLVRNQSGEARKLRGRSIGRIVLQGIKRDQLHPELVQQFDTGTMTLRNRGDEIIYLEVEPEHG